jgi:hypothetical protein
VDAHRLHSAFAIIIAYEALMLQTKGQTSARWRCS